jgi:hypothetical protein
MKTAGNTVSAIVPLRVITLSTRGVERTGQDRCRLDLGLVSGDW